MNEAFLPTPEEGEHAEELLAAHEKANAQGRGAFKFKNRMVDAPVVGCAEDVMLTVENANH